MAPASLAKKLRVHTAKRLLILNAPAGYAESLGDLPEGAQDVVYVLGAGRRAEGQPHGAAVNYVIN